MAMPQKVNGRKLFNAVSTSRKPLVDGLLLLRFHDAVAVVCEQHALQPLALDAAQDGVDEAFGAGKAVVRREVHGFVDDAVVAEVHL